MPTDEDLGNAWLRKLAGTKGLYLTVNTTKGGFEYETKTPAAVFAAEIGKLVREVRCLRNKMDAIGGIVDGVGWDDDGPVNDRTPRSPTGTSPADTPPTT